MNTSVKTFLLLIAFLAIQSCSIAASSSMEKETDEFKTPQRIEIKGYQDNAMEPFISRDGQYLFFNNSNEPPDKTDLFYAKKINDDSFQLWVR